MPMPLVRLLPLLLLLLAGLSSNGYADYLPADLRERVNQLQSELGSLNTTQTNVRARAELTWQWLNALALSDAYIPVNATQIVASVLASSPVNPRMIQALDNTMRELTLIDQAPMSLGTLSAAQGPYAAGSYATIKQTYIVGEREIQVGGGFMIAKHFMPNFGEWQAADPKAPNYISIQSNNQRVGFVATTKPLRGMHGGFRSARETLVFEVASGTLKPSDVVTITYGDTQAGSPGLLMPTFSTDRMPFPIYLSFGSRSQFYSLPIQPIRVVGTTLAGVDGFAPSVVSPNETFELSVRARDQFYNRSTDDTPDWLVELNGEPWLEIPATGAITVVETSIANEGVYYPTIRSKSGGVLGEINPILVTADNRDRIYWGDTHGHSGFAEGVGTPERFMQWARDDARLDYVTHSEHDVWLDDREWETLRDLVQAYTETSKFVPYLGYEWTVSTTRGGHHNVLFRNPETVQRVPSQFYPTLTSLYQGLKAVQDSEDVVVIPHAHQAGDFRMNDPTLEPLVEIMSQHGNFEWFGQQYLAHGHEVGFTAASDNHLSQPGFSAPQRGSLSQRGGLGAVLAPQKTVDTIFNAMKARKSYATTGDRIILDFSVNDIGMGQRAAFAKERKIEARVIGTAAIDNITVFKNNKPIWQEHYLTQETDRISREDTFVLTFSSASNPFHHHDNPRGWRSWEGTLEVKNASVDDIQPLDASFPGQTISVSASEPNTYTFATKTRGDTSSYLIKLKNVQRSTSLSLDLLEGKETGGGPPIYRPPQRIPADSFVLNVKDINKGVVAHTQVIDDYIDQTTLRRVNIEGAKTIEISLEDTDDKQGDYYYIRVVQANDAIAWSSPVWVGGHSLK